uniref:DCD domain-containing protein n=1 Tax=Lactuca sativa TaxID=4236 RepID=A0A9R1X7Q1_LACSA|nr:hypothetical protein LSAT_V11C500290970 [Lactuca sativa]
MGNMEEEEEEEEEEEVEYEEEEEIEEEEVEEEEEEVEYYEEEIEEEEEEVEYYEEEIEYEEEEVEYEEVIEYEDEDEETNKESAVKEDEKKDKEVKKGEELGEDPKSKEKRASSRDKSTKKSVVNGDNKPESSSRKKGPKRVESMGMVFMCSSKTKTDCFRYKILGLPANKQDQVAKIYKGMRLFLFDVDLRLMYGIFKAAGPGGYNIEPKAFKNEFPSQVRFSVLDDCLPVAEEKFKDVIKENYYTRNNFEGLLKADQVKKLCMLFTVTQQVENHRTRSDERRIRNREDESRDQKKLKIRDQEEERRFHPRSWSHSPPRREKRRYNDYEQPPVLYQRATTVTVRYLPPPPLPVASPATSYPYDHRAYREEIREQERDPYYVFYREAPAPTVYALPPEYHIVSREYHHPPPAVQPPPPPAEHRFSDYRDVGPPPEYRSHETHYRY